MEGGGGVIVKVGRGEMVVEFIGGKGKEVGMFVFWIFFWWFWKC